MKKMLIGLALLASAWILIPTSQADARGWRSWHHQGQRHHFWRHYRRSGFSAPELDPGAAGSAVVLLLGGVAYMSSRRRKEDLL